MNNIAEKKIFDAKQIVIYGAGKMGSTALKELQRRNMLNKVVCFCVTDASNQADQRDNIPVLPVNRAAIQYKDACYIISTNFRDYKDIESTLSNYGIENHVKIDTLYYSGIDISKELLDELNAPVEEITPEGFRKTIMSVWGEKQQWGTELYQSFPDIKVEGSRPTDIRIKEYGLLELLDSKQDVLDIGCNLGFLDITLAKYVKSITGVEYNESMVAIANYTKRYFGVKNVEFCNVDYKAWVKQNKSKYDVIFSFAVHGWLGVEPEDYVTQLLGMLKKGGYIVFESQVKEKENYDDYCNCFKRHNLSIMRMGKIEDVKGDERTFTIFNK